MTAVCGHPVPSSRTRSPPPSHAAGKSVGPAPRPLGQSQAGRSREKREVEFAYQEKKRRWSPAVASRDIRHNAAPRKK